MGSFLFTETDTDLPRIEGGVRAWSSQGVLKCVGEDLGLELGFLPVPFYVHLCVLNKHLHFTFGSWGVCGDGRVPRLASEEHYFGEGTVARRQGCGHLGGTGFPKMMRFLFVCCC